MHPPRPWHLLRSAYKLTIALMIAGLLASCSAGTSAPVGTSEAEVPPAQSGEPAVVRLGYVPVMIYAPLFVAIERGYFADENITIEPTPIQGGSDSVVQLAAGNFDVAIGGAGAGLFNAAAQGVEFTIVAPMHSERPPLTSPLVISANRTDEIQRIADLRGKRVAINATGAATEYWLGQALEQAGLTFDDIELQTVAFPNVSAALESGTLDASILGEPLVTIAEDQGLVAVLAEDFIEGFFATYVYMSEPLLEGRPEVARGFLRAYLRACRDLQGDYMTPEIAKIVETYTQVPADVTLRASPAQYDPNGTVPLDNLTTLQAYFLERGQLEYAAPLDVTAFTNTELAAEVARELDSEISNGDTSSDDYDY
ncbi:MAG: ABC transporter substrate-binding protein [Chloroflexaceae bacterium]|nr:ABC transporter substrate-binding protein [Chloroflexaceae bacterium]